MWKHTGEMSMSEGREGGREGMRARTNRPLRLGLMKDHQAMRKLLRTRAHTQIEEGREEGREGGKEGGREGEHVPIAPCVLV